MYVAVGIDDQHHGTAGQQCDRRQIPLHIEGRIGNDDLIDDDGQGRKEQRVAIIGGVSDIIGGDARAAARVLDRDLLSQQPSHALAQQAPGDVGRRAWRKADDEMDWACRIGFRPGETRDAPAARLRWLRVAGIVYGETSYRPSPGT